MSHLAPYIQLAARNSLASTYAQIIEHHAVFQAAVPTCRTLARLRSLRPNRAIGDRWRVEIAPDHVVLPVHLIALLSRLPVRIPELNLPLKLIDGLSQVWVYTPWEILVDESWQVLLEALGAEEKLVIAIRQIACNIVTAVVVARFGLLV